MLTNFSRKIFSVFSCICLFGHFAFGGDRSGLNVNIATYDLTGPFSLSNKVYLIVEDSLGRQTGYNPFTEEEFSNIPLSSYGSESITDNETDFPGPESFVLYIGKIGITEKYVFNLFALQDVKYITEINIKDNNAKRTYFKFKEYITANSTYQYTLNVDPTPGAPAPVISKEVTFDVLRNDILVAYKLNQLSDKKFKDELIKIIDRAEKLSIKCKKKKKDENCGNKKAAVNQLKSLIKRMEQALKKSEKDIKMGKDKKKKFITEEAFKIIKSDAEILIKDLDGKIKPAKKEKKTKKKGN